MTLTFNVKYLNVCLFLLCFCITCSIISKQNQHFDFSKYALDLYMSFAIKVEGPSLWWLLSLVAATPMLVVYCKQALAYHWLAIILFTTRVLTNFPINDINIGKITDILLSIYKTFNVDNNNLFCLFSYRVRKIIPKL